MYLKLSESGRTDGNNSNTHTFEQVTCSYDITITRNSYSIILNIFLKLNIQIPYNTANIAI